MPILQLQCTPWDKIYNVQSETDYEPQTWLVIQTESGQELAVIIDVVDQVSVIDEEIKIVRQANDDDLLARPTTAEKQSVMRYCYEAIKRLNLTMKLVDVHFSFDKNRLTFAFVANGRVDFRELVKDLTSHFNKNIRLQQIGIRDESKLTGDVGRCGRGLCCRQHLTKFTSVTGDMAEAQQLNSRGSDRISGTCGRLMCCLGYEYEGYKDKSEKMPPVGTRVNVDGHKGVVVSRNLLKETVDVKFKGDKGEADYLAEIDLNRHKKQSKL